MSSTIGPSEPLTGADTLYSTGAEDPRQAITDRRVRWLIVAGALAAAGLLRAARGYRPFPSIDDFAYVPMALARLDSHLYSRDVLLRDTLLHVPFLQPLVVVLQATTGLALGFWLITIALSLLTVFAMCRWMRALGLPGALLPIAAVVACAGVVQGFGRGEYDGVFGDAFHFQWAALCAVLWAYDSLLRAQRMRACALLVLSLLFHPVVGAQGVVATACGVIFARVGCTRARAWLMPAAVGACALLGLLVWFPLRGLSGDAIAELPEVAQALYFRTHEYDVDRVKVMFLLVLVAAGISGIPRLTRRMIDTPVALLLGLLTGHLLLLAADCVLFEARLVPHWSAWTLLPFKLSLSRTTPILLALSSVSAAAGLEAGFLEASGSQRSLRGFAWFATRGTQVATVIWVALFQVRWSWQVGVCCGVAALTAVAIRQKVAHRALAAVWLVAFAGGLVLFGRSAPLAASLKQEQDQLFQWARWATPADALFIVPPGCQEFRIYARRSVYVDFKTMTPVDSRLVLVWRQRLEQVAAPDRLAREARGWEGVAEWDRTYAGRNTPARIEWLLRETGADYFVWDRHGLRMPPFVNRSRAPVPTLVIAFENARYEVYRLVR